MGLIIQASNVLYENAYFIPPKQIAYFVVSKIGATRQRIPGRVYCEHCIDQGVKQYTIDYHSDRYMAMGKLLELQMKGYYTDVKYTMQDVDEIGDVIINRIRLTEDEISEFELQVRKLYPAKIEFDYSCHPVCGVAETGIQDCHNCGNLLDYELILTDDLLTSWEALTDQDLSSRMISEYESFTLYKIINAQNAGDFIKRIQKLCHRIIELSVNE